MSTDPGGVVGVSARYAAQIREMLYAQAVKREAERILTRRAEAKAAKEAQAVSETRTAQESETPRPVEPTRKTEAAPVTTSRGSSEPSAPRPPAQHVDTTA